MRNVNIYDYFKLFDVGVQFTPPTQSLACQSEEIPRQNAEVMTKMVKLMDNGCQTATRNETQTNF